MKISTHMRFSEEAKSLLSILSQRLGVSQTDIVEMSIREFAEKKGVKLEHKTPQDHIDDLQRRLINNISV